MANAGLVQSTRFGGPSECWERLVRTYFSGCARTTEPCPTYQPRSEASTHQRNPRDHLSPTSTHYNNSHPEYIRVYLNRAHKVMAPNDKAGRVVFIGNIPYGMDGVPVLRSQAHC